MTLILAGHDISDISVLAELTGLTILGLVDTPISDISALVGLENLMVLTLQDTN